MPTYRLLGGQISDLEIAKDERQGRTPVKIHSRPSPSAVGAVASNKQQAVPAQYGVIRSAPLRKVPFVDPAIISISHASRETVDRSGPQELQNPSPARVQYRSTATEASHIHTTTEKYTTHLDGKGPTGKVHINGSKSNVKELPGSTLARPLSNVKLDSASDTEEGSDERSGSTTAPNNAASLAEVTASIPQTSLPKRRRRKRGKGKGLRDGAPPIDKADEHNCQALGHGSGTTIIADGPADRNAQRVISGAQAIPEESAEQANMGQPRRQFLYSSKRTIHRRRAPAHDENDGWATEEATDIQGMGEFDFEANLSKFDKKTVFREIKAHDVVTNESRLVTLNRKPTKPGTAGGRNLHYTENVLDVPNTMGKWNSEAGETEEDDLAYAGLGSGRSSRRALSRHSVKRAPASKSNSRLVSSSHLLSPSSRVSLVPLNISTTKPMEKEGPMDSSPRKASLRLVPSNRLCPIVSPVQMLDIERIAEAEVGLTEEILTENAARNIAEVALSVVKGESREELRDDSKMIVLLAGNNQNGVRAVAAGRHLRNRGLRVMIYVLGLEREEDLLQSVQRQIQIFRKSGGKIVRWDELKASLATPSALPELIIDALLGMHASFDDLRADDQATICQLISWMNSANIHVLAVDVPSGVDASTGK